MMSATSSQTSWKQDASLCSIAAPPRLRSCIRASWPSPPYVCRVRKNRGFAVTEARPLDAEAQQIGIVRDQVGRLGCQSKQDELPALIRLVQVAVDPRVQSHARGTEPSTRLSATDLLDVSATTIALL